MILFCIFSDTEKTCLLNHRATYPASFADYSRDYFYDYFIGKK